MPLPIPDPAAHRPHGLWPALALSAAAALLAAAAPPAAAAPDPRSAGVLSPCRLKGVEHEALCGKVTRPLDPAAPAGKSIDVHYAVLPALARNKLPDPVFFLAGGPGQSAIDLAGPVSSMLRRFLNRRDVVLIDQRGTGRSAPLTCDDGTPGAPLADQFDPAYIAREVAACRTRLQALPHGDLRQYTTPIAMADADAVRQALGAAQVNLIGGSYGTRAALEYLRQFPQHVRRTVIDGIAPPDMVLPVSFSTDGQAAFDAMLGWCEADAACRSAFPALRQDWATLLAGLPREVTLPHPLNGRPQTLTLTRDTVLGMARLPLYMPAMTAGLPYAVHAAAGGRFESLVGLGGALGGGGLRLAMGMHLSVVCAEDQPRVAAATDRPGADFGASFSQTYQRLCDGWPRGTLPEAFYRVPPAPSAVLLLSGGIDPVTPPRHGERTARALGAKARHVVVPNAGHGTMALGCMDQVVFRFIDAADDAGALAVDADCARAMPRPTLITPPGAAR